MKHLVSSNNVNEINRALLKIQESMSSVPQVATQASSSASSVGSTFSYGTSQTSNVPVWAQTIQIPFGVLNVSNGQLLLDSDGCASMTVIQ